MEKKISKCKNGHYYQGDTCPHCGEKVAVEEYEQREGDCIACGQLCPDGAYGCNEPSPIEEM